MGIPRSNGPVLAMDEKFASLIARNASGYVDCLRLGLRDPVGPVRALALNLPCAVWASRHMLIPESHSGSFLLPPRYMRAMMATVDIAND